ncbi:unnamed protein product, partial [Scytosiphon promiscuus]
MPNLLVKKAVMTALEEDLGLRGDITTNNIFDEKTVGTA